MSDEITSGRLMKLGLARKHCRDVLDTRVTLGIGKLLANALLLVIEYLIERDADEEPPLEKKTIMPPRSEP